MPSLCNVTTVRQADSLVHCPPLFSRLGARVRYSAVVHPHTPTVHPHTCAFTHVTRASEREREELGQLAYAADAHVCTLHLHAADSTLGQRKAIWTRRDASCRSSGRRRRSRDATRCSLLWVEGTQRGHESGGGVRKRQRARISGVKCSETHSAPCLDSGILRN